jgi:phosphoribosylamine--glycine ligase
MAAEGYPEHVHVGQAIDGLDRAAALDGVTVFHGGTRADKGRIVTAGGRVVTVVGRGADFRTAIDRAYAGVDANRFDGARVRRDIGAKAL